jgi:hypothetical protein
VRALSRLSVLCALSALGGACSSTRAEQVGRQESRLDLATAEVGPAFATDAPAPKLAHVGHSPAIAFDGTRYAVMFEEAAKVRAVRVASDGSVLDLEWLDFGSTGVAQTNPSVAFGNGKYLAVWSESERNGDGALTVQARLFAPSGALEGSQSFRVSAGEGLLPAVTFDGEEFVVAFQNLADGGHNAVHVVRIAVTGTTIVDSEVPVTSNGMAGRPVITHGDSQTLVAWEDRTDDLYVIRAARLDSAGNVLDPGGFRVSDSSVGEDSPAVAAIGDDFLVAWRRSDTPTSIRGSIVSADGTVTTRDIALSRSTLAAGLPSVAATADAYLVAWADERDEHSIYGTRVSKSGALLDAADRKLAADAPRSTSLGDPTAVAAGEAQFLIAFIGEGVQGSLVDAQLTLEDGSIPISAVPSTQGSQQVSWTGDNYVISWIDERSAKVEDVDARAVRIGADGRRLDPKSIVLASPGAYSLSQAARGDATWLAAWTLANQPTLYTRHVAADGTPGTPHEFSDLQIWSSPSLASNGDDYLAVYAELVNPDSYTVYGRKIASDGTPGIEFPISSALPQSLWLAVAAHGDGYLVAIHDQTSLRLLTVGSDNAVGTPLTVAEGRGYSAISSNGEQALIAIGEDRDAGGRVSARLYEDGALKGDLVALAEASSGLQPRVVWDGESFVVAWEALTGALEARTLTADGALSPTRTLIEADCISPALASNGAGQLLVTCIRYAESAFTRRLASYFIGDVPEVADPPATGGRPNQGTGGSDMAGAAGEASGNGGVTTNGGTNGSAGSDGESGGSDAATGGSNAASGGRAASGGLAGGGMPNSPPAGSGGSAGIAAPVAGAAPNDGSDPDDGGCGCKLQTPASRKTNPLAIALALAAALACRRRRS